MFTRYFQHSARPFGLHNERPAGRLRAPLGKWLAGHRLPEPGDAARSAPTDTCVVMFHLTERMGTAQRVIPHDGTTVPSGFACGIDGLGETVQPSDERAGPQKAHPVLNIANMRRFWAESGRTGPACGAATGRSSGSLLFPLGNSPLPDRLRHMRGKAAALCPIDTNPAPDSGITCHFGTDPAGQVRAARHRYRWQPDRRAGRGFGPSRRARVRS